jgi:RimJ/RimL family protein N-acetyltransferase
VVTLRPAGADDAARLYAWRVDAETAQQSVSPPPSSLASHREWFDAQLRDPDVTMFIGHDTERRVDIGVVRLERRAAETELSITVAPEERGRGYSHDLIARGVDAAGPVRVVARVKPRNERSLRAFRSSGFAGDEERDGLVWLVRDCATTVRGARA